jgi:hypothetical protein
MTLHARQETRQGAVSWPQSQAWASPARPPERPEEPATGIPTEARRNLTGPELSRGTTSVLPGLTQR